MLHHYSPRNTVKVQNTVETLHCINLSVLFVLFVFYSFDINLYTGPADGDDIAFHFNPRIGQYTALNSFRNGQWETEESAPNKPFTAGAPFYMFVVITPNGYEVSVKYVHKYL